MRLGHCIETSEMKWIMEGEQSHLGHGNEWSTWKNGDDGSSCADYCTAVRRIVVSSMIHSAKPTVPSVMIIIFNWKLLCFERFWKTADEQKKVCTDEICVKIVIISGRGRSSGSMKQQLPLMEKNPFPPRKSICPNFLFFCQIWGPLWPRIGYPKTLLGPFSELLMNYLIKRNLINLVILLSSLNLSDCMSNSLNDLDHVKWRQLTFIFHLAHSHKSLSAI